MKKVPSVARTISFLVIISFLSLVISPGYSQSLKGSSIKGRILSSDQNAPVAGAIVKAANIKSKKIYESKPTIENGYYEISGLQKGTYDIAVQMDEGLYVVNKLLNLGENKSHTLSLALKETPATLQEEEEKEKKEEEKAKEGEEQGKEEEGEEEEGEEVITPEDEEMDEEKLGFWDNPVTASFAFAGIATVLGFGIEELTEEEERPSPF